MLFPESSHLTPTDPQEHIDPNSTQGRLKQVFTRCGDFVELEQVYKAQFAEMCQQLDAQKSKIQKMMEEFKYFSKEEYSKMFDVFETKKAKLEAHFEENKEI